MSKVKIDRRLYLTADRSRAVPEGDPEARFLLCVAGGEVPREQAARLGLLDPPAEPEEKSEVESKAGRRPADKSRRPAANKAPGKPAAKPDEKAGKSGEADGGA